MLCMTMPAVSPTKLVVGELALRNGNLLLELGDALAPMRGDNLDGHGRNARTLASHNPGTTKAAVIGAWEAPKTRLSPKGFSGTTVNAQSCSGRAAV